MRRLGFTSLSAVALAWAASCSLSQLGTGPELADAAAEVGGDATPESASPVDAGDEADAGALDAPLDAPTCDASLRTDPNNCGRCGHDCLGGPCFTGACAPMVLATGLDQGAHMALDGTSVYVASRVYGGDVWVVPKSGIPDGGTAPRLATNYNSPNRVAVALSFAAFTTQNVSGSVHRCALPPDGICGGPAIDQNLNSADGIATDGSLLFYAVGGTGEIRVCPQVGCSLTSSVLVSTLRAPAAIAVVGSDTFFTERGDNIGRTNGRVQKCSVTGCNNIPTLIADNQTDPQSLAVFGGTVFWGNNGSGVANDGALFACSASACGTPTTIASRQYTLGDLAVDGTGVYFTNTGAGNNGGVLHCPLAGCGAAGPTMVTPVNMPGAIAIDAQAIYWTSYTDRTLSKIAR